MLLLRFASEVFKLIMVLAHDYGVEALTGLYLEVDRSFGQACILIEDIRRTHKTCRLSLQILNIFARS